MDNKVLLSVGVFAGILVVALFGPMLVPYDPLASIADKALQPPGWDHWFGTDALGRDVFSRVIVARLDSSRRQFHNG